MLYATQAQSCPDLKEELVFYHDENTYMPEPYCDAIERAGMALRDLKPYRVTKTMVDLGFQVSAVRSFATEYEAIDFMLTYDGDGDCLHLVHGQLWDEETIGYVDLWKRDLEFIKVDTHARVYHDSNDVDDEDIPF